MYALRLENCDEDEAEEFLEELYAPLDPLERAAEQKFLRDLRGT